MKDFELSKLADLLAKVGQIVLQNGGEAYRAEKLCIQLAKKIGENELDILAIPTGITMTLTGANGKTYTVLRRLKKRGVNLNKIAEVSKIVEDIKKQENDEHDLVQINNKLDKLLESSKTNIIKQSIFAGLSAAFFTVLFGGIYFDFIVSFVCGLLTHCVALKFKRNDLFHFLISIIGRSYNISGCNIMSRNI